MIATHSEIPVKEGEKEISNPGLRLVLQHNPNLELKNQDGHTPLVMSVYKRDYDKTSLLVCYNLITVLCPFFSIFKKQEAQLFNFYFIFNVHWSLPEKLYS